MGLFSLDSQEGRTFGFQKILDNLRDLTLYLVAMGNVASRNNKVTGFHRFSSVPATFRAGPGNPCVAFLGFWKNDSFLALWCLISKAFFSFLLTSLLPLHCRLLSRLNQSPGNTLKLVPGFTSEIQYAESNYQKFSQLACIATPFQNTTVGCLYLYSLIHKMLQASPLRETS